MIDELIDLEKKLEQLPRQQVGENLRRLREKRGFSQSALADATEIEAGTLSRIENGERQLRLQHVLPLMRVLGVSPGELIGEVQYA